LLFCAFHQSKASKGGNIIKPGYIKPSRGEEKFLAGEKHSTMDPGNIFASLWISNDELVIPSSRSGTFKLCK
jgi:hypothetical protein